LLSSPRLCEVRADVSLRPTSGRPLCRSNTQALARRAGKVAAGTVQKAVIVETKKEFQRRDGSVVKFHQNSCVLVDPKNKPLGSRVLGFATHELRARQLMKVLSLATRVI